MWKNSVERSMPQMTIRRMRITCWIPRATNTHSEYVLFIAFPLHNSCKNAPSCYLLCTLTVLLDLKSNDGITIHMMSFPTSDWTLNTPLTVKRMIQNTQCFKNYCRSIGNSAGPVDGTGDKYTASSFVICTSGQTIFWWLNQEGRDGRGMWHVWGSGEVHTGF